MKKTIQIAFTVIRVAIAIALLYYLTVYGAIDWRVLLSLGTNLPISTLCIILLLMSLVVQAKRLCILLRPHELHLSLYSSIKLTSIGILFNSCMPGSTGGDAVKIYYAMEGNRGRRTEVATLLLLDRVIGMFALLNFPLLLAFIFPRLYQSFGFLRGLLWSAALVSGTMLIASLAFLVRAEHQRGLSSKLFERIPFGSYPKRILDTIYAYRKSPITLLVAFLISILNHALNAGVILLLIVAANPDWPTLKMCILIPFGFLASALPVTPGGLGVGETAFDRLFGMAGLDGGAVMILGWRVMTLLIGGLGLIFYLQGRKRLIITPGSPAYFS